MAPSFSSDSAQCQNRKGAEIMCRRLFNDTSMIVFNVEFMTLFAMVSATLTSSTNI